MINTDKFIGAAVPPSTLPLSTPMVAAKNGVKMEVKDEGSLRVIKLEAARGRADKKWFGFLYPPNLAWRTYWAPNAWGDEKRFGSFAGMQMFL